MDATGSMTKLLEKAKNSVNKMFRETRKILESNNLNKDLIMIQFAVYRNYDCSPNQLLEHSGWETNPENLKNFMHGIRAGGGIIEEAVEIGLQHAI